MPMYQEMKNNSVYTADWAQFLSHSYGDSPITSNNNLSSGSLLNRDGMREF